MKRQQFLPGIILTLLAIFLTRQGPVQAATIYPIAQDPTGFKSALSAYRNLAQPEGLAINNPQAYRLDPTNLRLLKDYEVRVFFLNEGAGKRNTLTYSTTGPTPAGGTVFSAISCRANCEIPEVDGNLNVGDWTSLGSFQAGTLFDFKLLAKNLIDGTIDTYGAEADLNPDRLDHLVAYQFQNRVVLGFEDLFGPLQGQGGRNEFSDRDFNDVVFVVDLPVSTPVEKVPEPTAVLGLLTIWGLGLLRLIR